MLETHNLVTGKMNIKEIAKEYGWHRNTAGRYVNAFKKEVLRDKSMINDKYLWNPNRNVIEVNLEAFDYFYRNFNSFQDEVQRKHLTKYKF